MARKQQEEQVYAQQQAAQERQRQEHELQEQARRAQQEKMMKQQQEALERQRQEEERARQVQMQNAAQPEYRSSSRKPKKEEFFSAPPDSEYSDTDASSVLSGPPPNRYAYLQSQVSGSSAGPLPSVNAQRAAGVAAAPAYPPQPPVESDDSRSEYSADSSRSGLRRRDDLPAGVTAAKRAPKPNPNDATTRAKQLHDGVIQAKSTNDLCDLFGVSTPGIFTGGT